MKRETAASGVVGSPTPRHMYVHVPFCDSRCTYCAFHSGARDTPLVRRFIEALERQVHRWTDRGSAWEALQTLYIGGGTPSSVPLELLSRLLSLIKPQREPCEWSIEVNPASAAPEKLQCMRQHGVSRVSVGVQSFFDNELHWMGRPYTSAGATETVELVRQAGFASVGIDLIAAFPERTMSVWQAMLERAAHLAPDHISVYALSFEPGTALSEHRAQGAIQPMPDEEQIAHLEFGREWLKKEGWARYEISNFARPGHACRHNMAVWRGQDYLGIGPSASSRLGLLRRTYIADTVEYCRALEHGEPPPAEEETVSVATDARERLIFRLRTSEGLPYDGPDLLTLPVAQRDIVACWLPVLRGFAAKGLANVTRTRVRLSPRGMLLADTIMGELIDT